MYLVFGGSTTGSCSGAYSLLFTSRSRIIANHKAKGYLGGHIARSATFGPTESTVENIDWTHVYCTSKEMVIRQFGERPENSGCLPNSSRIWKPPCDVK